MQNKKKNVRKLEKFRIESENGLIFEKKIVQRSLGPRLVLEQGRAWNKITTGRISQTREKFEMRRRLNGTFWEEKTFKLYLRRIT